MKQYRIIIDSTAENDLDEILTYISATLHAEYAAQDLYSKIKAAILSLAQMPQRHQILDEEPYNRIGVRHMLVDNYLIFYFIDENNSTVRVFRILYNRREWQGILFS